MKLTRGTNVQCHDGNVYAISYRTDDNYVVGLSTKDNTSLQTQRLFKPDGHYAGSDKAKNVARVL